MRLWSNLDHNINIAIWAVITPRARAEQCRMSNATFSQGVFVLPQAIKNILFVHGANYTPKI